MKTFEEILPDILPHALAAVRRGLGARRGVDIYEESDILQEVLIGFWKSYQSGNAYPPYSTLIYTIARRAVENLRRKTSAVAVRQLETEPHYNEGIVEGVWSALDYRLDDFRPLLTTEGFLLLRSCFELGINLWNDSEFVANLLGISTQKVRNLRLAIKASVRELREEEATREQFQEIAIRFTSEHGLIDAVPFLATVEKSLGREWLPAAHVAIAQEVDVFLGGATQLAHSAVQNLVNTGISHLMNARNEAARLGLTGDEGYALLSLGYIRSSSSDPRDAALENMVQGAKMLCRDGRQAELRSASRVLSTEEDKIGTYARFLGELDDLFKKLNDDEERSWVLEELRRIQGP